MTLSIAGMLAYANIQSIYEQMDRTGNNFSELLKEIMLDNKKNLSKDDYLEYQIGMIKALQNHGVKFEIVFNVE